MNESRIHLLGNGISDCQKAKIAAQNVTIAELTEALQAERVENENMVKWYMEQIPGLVATMLGDALAAQGKELAPPPAEEPCRDCGNVGHHGIRCPRTGAMIPDGDYSAAGSEPDVDTETA